jgi:fused signal recognition particle receptor
MTGFFKRLFNRITGRGKEETKPDEQPVLPPPFAPEPEPVTDEVVLPASPPSPAPTAAGKLEDLEPSKAQTPAAKARADEPPPKVTARPAPRRPEPQKPTAKKPEPKQTGVKKPEAKKEVLKGKPEKKAEAPKPVAKQAKASLKEVEPKGAEANRPEARKKAEPKSGRTGLAPRKAPEPAATETPPSPLAKPVAAEAPAQKPVDVQTPPPAPVVVEASPTPPPPPPAPVAAAAPAPVPEEPERKGWFARLRDGLSKSSKSITSSITSIFTKRKLDAATLQDLEDVLIQADLGIAVSERIIKAVSAGRYDKEIDPQEVKAILASEVAKVLKPVEVPFNFGEEKPFVILVVGVNGSGKTTTIGKLGAIATGEGFKVMFAACDTFRAAAIEQLTIWGQRIGARTMARPTGSDAAGLAFDAMKEAVADGTDILFIDTAGRLHNKAYLMDELDKVVRVIKKLDEKAPHAVLLVLDATTGQNAMAQAEAFTKVAGVTGIIMTKLDGTARGGILVAIAEKYKLPIHAVGVGEKIDDLQPFDAEAFSRAIAGLEDA